MKALLIAACCVFAIGTSAAWAAELKDKEGSKDHPLLKRYEGAVIVEYEHTEFDEYTLPLGNADKNNKLTKSLPLEGEITRLLYRIPKGRSTLEVMRNYENDLKASGYAVLFSGAKSDLGNIAQAAQWHTPTYLTDTARAMTAKLTRPRGDVYVALFAVQTYHQESNLGLEQGQTVLLAHVIVSKPMEKNKLMGAKDM
jgi:hypothetical protein